MSPSTKLRAAEPAARGAPKSLQDGCRRLHMAVQAVPKGFPSPQWRNPFSSHILLGFGGDWGLERGRAAHPPRQGPTGALQHQSRVVAWVFWGLLRHFMVPLAMVIWGAPIAHWGPACAQGWGGLGAPPGVWCCSEPLHHQRALGPRAARAAVHF